MFYVLSKVLGLFVNPLFWIVLFLIVGLFLKSKKLRKYFLVATLSCLLFFSNRFVADRFLSVWENFKKTNYKQVDQYSYGVVLGGMIDYSEKRSGFGFSRSGDRIFQALKLYKQKRIKKILISSGFASFFYQDTIESALLKNYLVDIGVPSDDIVTEERSRNTYENAVFTKELLTSEDTVLLITSASHMRRSYKCFEKAGVVCDTFSADYRAKPIVFNFEEIFIPSYKGFQKWQILFHEVIGIISYKISGYI